MLSPVATKQTLREFWRVDSVNVTRSEGGFGESNIHDMEELNVPAQDEHEFLRSLEALESWEETMGQAQAEPIGEVAAAVHSVLAKWP